MLENRKVIGKILKLTRESKNISQKEIGKRVGYENINQISMIEHGKTSIPINKISIIVSAYELKDIFKGVIMKFVHYDAYEEMFTILDNPSERNRIESKIIENLSETSKDLNIEIYLTIPKGNL